MGLVHCARKYLMRLDVDDNMMVAVFYALYSRLQIMQYGIILVYLMLLGT